MEIWLSAEAQDDVSEGLRYAQLKIKGAINPRLTGDYGSSVEEWALINILRPRIPEGWGEVHQYHPRRRVAEFRLIVDYDAFRAATAEIQVLILLRSLLRSLDLFPTLNVANFDVDRLRRDILDAASSEGWNVNDSI